MKKKRKLTREQKDRANARARERREIKAQQKYKELINTMNLKMQDYYETFGNSGFEYDNLATSVEKIFMKNFDFILENGSNTKAMSINPVASTISDNKKNLRSTITRAYKFLNKQLQAKALAEELYGTTDEKTVQIKATIKKLENDVSPNYYQSLSVLSSRESMPFKSKFSKELKGKSKSDDSFKDSYDKLGQEIIDFLNKKVETENKVLEKIHDKNLGEATTLSEILKRMKK